MTIFDFENMSWGQEILPVILLSSLFVVVLISPSIWYVGGRGGPSASHTLQTTFFLIRKNVVCKVGEGDGPSVILVIPSKTNERKLSS